ncbi:MAG: glycosyltransferase family 39 protein [Xanthomonadales bacterium]|nr:glycosyltransferase family 39 protein [Xanthomonadales bacterium]
MIVALIYGAWSEPFYFGPHDGPVYYRLAGASLEKGPFHCGLYEHSYWAPAWVEMTALLYRVFGHHPQVIQVFLSLCLVWSAYISYRWSRSTLGHGVALAAAALSMSTIYLFQFTTFHQYELLVGACLVTAAYLTISRDAYSSRRCVSALWRSGLAGLLTAIAVLSAAKMVLFAAAIALAMLIRSARKGGFGDFWAFVLTGGLVSAAWIARNAYCFGEFIPLTTNGGVVYYMAHNPLSRMGGEFDPNVSVWPVMESLKISPHESSRWYALANEYIARHPVETARDAWIKLWLFFKPKHADQVLVLTLCMISVCLAALRRLRLSVDAVWWLAIPVGLAVVHSMYHLESRYLLPVWPFLAMFGAQALATRVK